MSTELKTPLYDAHVALGGKIVPFAGYLLPVQYPTGVITEHKAVRQKAGLFDVSHMGEITFKGKSALDCLNHLLCNDYTKMDIGRVRYSPMLNDQGGVVDDVLVYKLASECYLMVVNAANKDKDVSWIKAHAIEGCEINDISDTVAQIALQGPLSEEILKKLADPRQIPQKYYSFNTNVNVGGVTCLLSRTGYTGEDGFELYCAPDQAQKLWYALMDAGKDTGLIPCGLGCRDTLRMEAAMPLYGHEMDDTVSPLETGLGHFVKLQKPSFIGKDALGKMAEPKRARVGLQMIGRGIAREHFDVYDGDTLVGHTTSGTHSPTLGYPVAMALVDAACASEGKRLFVDIRGSKVEAQVVPLPFYHK